MYRVLLLDNIHLLHRYIVRTLVSYFGVYKGYLIKVRIQCKVCSKLIFCIHKDQRTGVQRKQMLCALIRERIKFTATIDFLVAFWKGQERHAVADLYYRDRSTSLSCM